MSAQQSGSSRANSQTQLLRDLDQACDSFEAALCAGLNPLIADYLEGVSPPARSQLLRELVALEVSYRCQSGRTPDCAEYETRFPDDTSAVRDAFQGYRSIECLSQNRKTPSPSPSPADGGGGFGIGPKSRSSQSSQPTTNPSRSHQSSSRRPTACPLTSDQSSTSQPAQELFSHLSSGVPSNGRLQLGAKVGRYTIQQVLGQGSFGIVYLACDEQLQRAVTIKMPRPECVIDPANFVREAQTSAKLSHPSIVAVYDAGRLADGAPYAVMEYVEGSSLQELLAGDRLSHVQLTRCFSSVAGAIHHAHTRGFVHRDLKPDNILIDGAGVPHIADFGLALHETAQQKHYGDASGTPYYRSPEQVRGDAHWMDGRCDIWAIGVMLYELLTGRHPFHNSQEIQFRDPKPPRQIDDTIPESLERICLTCLAKSVGDRYPTADTLAKELQQVCQELAGDHVTQVIIRQDADGHAIATGAGNVVVFRSGVQAITTEEPAAVELGPNPYKGLLAFDEEDAHLFFGREEQTRRLWERLRLVYDEASVGGRTPRIVPILGASGCGKSSLTRAGLVAELARRPLPGWPDAHVVVFTPGARPLERLAGVLARIATGDDVALDKVAEFERLMTRREKRDGLRRIVDLLPEAGRAPLILLIDQFEEIYCLCDDSEERTIFVENLLNATGDPGSQVALVFTLRCDFLGAAQEQKQLNRVISEQAIIVPAMTEAELRRTITEPARQMHHSFDPALVDLLIEQTRNRDGALPLLQFALTRIWDGLARGFEPAATLEQIGGVGGALAGEADRIYSSLTPTDQRIARRVFLALVQLGEGTRDTRRRATIEQMLTSGDDPAQFRRVIDRFARPGVRLITLSGEGGGSLTAEVSHEALFEHWQQLQDWLASSRDDIRFQRLLEQAARHWDDSGRPPGLLWRPPDLDALGQFRERCLSELTPLQLEFATASDQQQRHEKSRSRRRARFFQSAAVIVAGLLSALVFLSLMYRQHTQHARVQSYLGDVQLAYAAWQERDTVRTRELLKRSAPDPGEKDERGFAWHYLWGQCQIAMEQNPLEDATFPHAGQVTALALSGDGQRLASGGSDVIRVHNANTGQLVWETTDLGERIRSLALSGDGSRLVSAGGSLRIWNVADGTLAEILAAGRSVHAVAISPDERWLASGHGLGLVRVWDLRSRELLVTLRGHARAVKSVVFSPDGQTLASGDGADSLRLWDVASGEQVTSCAGTVATFASHGRLLATAGRSRFVQIWDISDKKQPRALPGLKVRGSVRNLTFVNDRVLLLAYDAGKWELYDLLSGDYIGDLRDGSGLWSAVTFSRDGDCMAWATGDGEQLDVPVNDESNGARDSTVRLCRVRVDEPVKSLPTTADWVTSVVMAGDGDSLAIATGKYSPPFTSDRGTMQQFTIESGKRVLVSDGELEPSEAVHWLCLALSPDSCWLACGGFRYRNEDGETDGIAALYHTQADNSSPTIVTHDNWVRSIAFSPDGDLLAVGSRLGPTVLWKVDDRRNPQKQAAFKIPAWSLAFSPDGQILAAGGGAWGHGRLALVDIEARRILASCDQPAGLVTSVLFFPDGKRLAAADYGGNITFYDLTLQPRTRLLAHNTAIRALALTAPERSTSVLASGGLDGLVKLWHVATGTQLGSLANDVGVLSLSFAEDGQALVAGMADGRARLWRTVGDDRMFGSE